MLSGLRPAQKEGGFFSLAGATYSRRGARRGYEGPSSRSGLDERNRHASSHSPPEDHRSRPRGIALGPLGLGRRSQGNATGRSQPLGPDLERPDQPVGHGRSRRNGEPGCGLPDGPRWRRLCHKDDRCKHSRDPGCGLPDGSKWQLPDGRLKSLRDAAGCRINRSS
jgi:hypothetical protein